MLAEITRIGPTNLAVKKWMLEQVLDHDAFIDECDVVQEMDLASAAMKHFKDLSWERADKQAHHVFIAYAQIYEQGLKNNKEKYLANLNQNLTHRSR